MTTARKYEVLGELTRIPGSREEAEIVVSLVRQHEKDGTNRIMIDFREHVTTERYVGPTKKGFRVNLHAIEEISETMEVVRIAVTEMAETLSKEYVNAG